MKNPLRPSFIKKGNRDTWFYYYAKPIEYRHQKIWKSKHIKTGFLQFACDLKNGKRFTYFWSLDAAKEALDDLITKSN